MIRIRLITVMLLSWMVAGCSDSAPLKPVAPEVAFRSSAVVAPASSTQFDGFINFCEPGPVTDFKESGTTIHFRVSNLNKWVTGNPLIDGYETNTGRAVIDPHGLVVNLGNSIKPDAVNGTWEIKQQFRIPDGTTSGVGRGTGDLLGMTMKFTTEPIIPSPSDCNPNEFKGAVHGVILSPAR
jgi:hypothetical protein